MISDEKQRLREQMKAKAVDCSINRPVSPIHRLMTSDAWTNAFSVLLYSPIGSEADTTTLISAAAERSLVFPRINGEVLELYRMTPESNWVTGLFGIAEPDPATWEPFGTADLDLALVPGLAFDRDGGRLGRGKGFYDRLLGNSDFRGIKAGIAWDWQLVDRVPRESHDILMDLIVTEGKLHWTGSGLDNQGKRR
jgi:5-formyltetrahydrofolate cyclo-ligase